MRLIRLPMLLLAGLLAGLVALVAAPGTCFACSCLPPGPPAEALAQADTVFRGRVIAVTRERTALGGEYQRVTLRADAGWKGMVTSEMRVYTAVSSAACGYPFRQGEEYLVYASISRDAGSPHSLPANALTTGLCSRTAPIAQASTDLAALGPGTLPADAPLPNLPNTGTGARPARGGAVIAALALVAALPVGILALRRRRA